MSMSVSLDENRGYTHVAARWK